MDRYLSVDAYGPRPVEEVIDLPPGGPEFMTPNPGHATNNGGLQNPLASIFGANAHLVLLVVVGRCSEREAAAALWIGPVRETRMTSEFLVSGTSVSAVGVLDPDDG